MPKTKALKKDPNKPKRALTGFLFYSKERRPQLKEMFPDMGFGEMGKRLGEEWKNMSDDQKDPYNKLAADDKARYDNAMSTYQPDPMYSRKGKRKDPNRPKRAMSAYLYFCKALRETVKAEFPEKSMVEIQKVLGARWKDTSEAERQPYLKQAEADRQRYDREMLNLSQQGGQMTSVLDDGGYDDEDDDDEDDE
ncbi:High mobility group protein B1 [Hondaea fermentalgiana]|uniref:High mobility group protein B1 n=1 Tax=Hondaea fermentalgiana TaxID=2315210 RepID=A0A2R5GRM0_9STRA|nr:High mobility group protein B1 [Hondaea fermentalgiana]|eukprot:GBG32408.1 High mobility group protein B1 [Hondaea fermentalgiana]